MSYDRPKTVGKMCGYYGNVSPILKAYTYILSLGGLGLREVSEIAVLNSNYIANKLKQVKGLTLPYAPDKPRKHEAVLSSSKLVEETGVSTLNIAKKLLDYGIHAPTVYFPLIVPEALMVEPTETEPVESLDAFIDAVTHITELAYSDPENVLNAHQNTVVGKLDEARAAHPRTICLSWSKYCRLIPET